MRYIENLDEIVHDWKVRCIIWTLIGLTVGAMAGIWATQDQMEQRYINTINKFYLTYTEQDRQWRELFPGHEVRKVGKR